MRVLVVEDDRALANLIVQGLREQDMVVDVAFDGAEALNKAENTVYDVIVLDRDLPVLHGDAVCQALSGRCPARILMLTAAAAGEALLAVVASTTVEAADTDTVARARRRHRRAGQLRRQARRLRAEIGLDYTGGRPASSARAAGAVPGSSWGRCPVLSSGTYL